MKLLPIHENIAENQAFQANPICDESLGATIDYYKKIGFVPPWIGYYAEQNGALVGAAAFKGKPVDGTVEIAYGTFEPYQQQGIGAAMCGCLVRIAQESDPAVRITARTLPEEGFSTKILQKNGFVFSGTITDPDDGDVWEWLYVS